MSYQNIVRPVMQFLSLFEAPMILEIGVDNGQTTVPLCHNMTHLNRPWLYEGVDIQIKNDLLSQLSAMSKINCFGKSETPEFELPTNIHLYELNSFDFFKAAIEQKRKYNLILIDGDHNYLTVKKELPLAEKLAHPSTLIVCDDYNTAHAHNDFYYGEREDYADNKLANKRQKTKKTGVCPAIDEFVKNSQGKWGILPGLGKPTDYCILYQKENVLDMNLYHPEGTKLASEAVLEVYFNIDKCPEVNESALVNLDYNYERPGPRIDHADLDLLGAHVRLQQVINEFMDPIYTQTFLKNAGDKIAKGEADEIDIQSLLDNLPSKKKNA